MNPTRFTFSFILISLTSTLLSADNTEGVGTTTGSSNPIVAPDPMADVSGGLSETELQKKPVYLVEVQVPWARVSSGKNGACYVTIISGQDDQLLSASAPSTVCDRVELHTHTELDGVMQMRPVSSIPVMVDAPLVMQPGGLHIMLMGLKKPLKLGETFTLTLNFEKTGAMQIAIPVQARVPVSTAMLPIMGKSMHDQYCCGIDDSPASATTTDLNALSETDPKIEADPDGNPSCCQG